MKLTNNLLLSLACLTIISVSSAFAGPRSICPKPVVVIANIFSTNPDKTPILAEEAIAKECEAVGLKKGVVLEITPLDRGAFEVRGTCATKCDKVGFQLY